ncbi:MAG: SgcJ/EcaC family oxidoreductase [Proteobacteria bacterium]|nr:SgcJ/EcaC family oxidoreductase [Pseudomonadota bacterium]
MKQVRVCRGARVKHFHQDVLLYGEWVEATDEALEHCETIEVLGNELFGPGSHWVELRDVDAERMLPELAARRVIDESLQAWVDGDMDRHMGYFTLGATLITPTGACHRGRVDLRAAFEHERAAMPGLRMVVEERQISHPAPDTCIVMMEGTIVHSGMPQPERWASTQTLVSGADAQWRIASHQVHHVRREVAEAA